MSMLRFLLSACTSELCPWRDSCGRRDMRGFKQADFHTSENYQETEPGGERRTYYCAFYRPPGMSGTFKEVRLPEGFEPPKHPPQFRCVELPKKLKRGPGDEYA